VAVSWHSNRHSGGVKGTRLARTMCPVCGRDTAGGNMNRERTQIQLKAHKRVMGGVRDWCPGSRRLVFWR
jgi:hypothetical protein